MSILQLYFTESV